MIEIIDQGYSQATGYYVTLYTEDGTYFICQQNDPRDSGEIFEVENEDDAQDLFDNLMGK